MKYNLVKIGIFTLLLVFLGGCANISPDISDANNASQEVVEEETTDDPNEGNDESQQQSDSQIIQDLKKLVLNDGDSVSVAAYIRGNINNATPEEADQMVEILLQMQTELIQKAHEGLLYEPEYLEALNKTMGGVLAPDKVHEIENETVRAFFQAVVDSDLTMVRYEETPVLETDWNKIGSYGATFTEAFQLVVDFHDYNNLFREENVDALVQRTYMMEVALPNLQDGFAKAQLTELYSTYVSKLLAGPEGSYLYRLGDKDDDYYKKMEKAIAEDVSISGFAKTANVMMTEETRDFNHLINIVDSYRMDNPYGEHHWQNQVSEEDGIVLNKLIYVGEGAEKVNNILDSATEDLIKESDTTSNYQIDMRKSYQYGDFATIYIYINYTKADGETDYRDKAVNIDLKKGNILTLSDLLNTTENKVLEKVNALSGADFKEVPNFSLISTGILLTGDNEDPQNLESAVITENKVLKCQLTE